MCRICNGIWYLLYGMRVFYDYLSDRNVPNVLLKRVEKSEWSVRTTEREPASDIHKTRRVRRHDVW